MVGKNMIMEIILRGNILTYISAGAFSHHAPTLVRPPQG